MAYALDPDKEGAIVWQYRIGQGSGLGGQWGGAVRRAAGVLRRRPICCRRTPGGIRAVNLATGEIVWSVAAAASCCAPSGRTLPRVAGRGGHRDPRRACSRARSTAACAPTPTKDGTILWTFDTNKEFPTVNGVKANGGGLEGPGAIVVGGMLYFNSGYGGFVGNGRATSLLAFGID